MSDEELQQMDKEQLLGIIKAQRFEISILKDDKEHLGEFLKEKDEEIERLNNLLKETSQTLSEQTTKAITLKSENERLKNDIKKITEITNQKIKIINDVREYIENNSYFESNVVKTMVFKDYSKGILDILEKENK